MIWYSGNSATILYLYDVRDCFRSSIWVYRINNRIPLSMMRYSGDSAANDRDTPLKYLHNSAARRTLCCRVLQCVLQCVAVS